MNRRGLILSVAALGAAAFGGATWFVNRPAPASETETIAPERAEALIRPYSPILGPEDAPVTIVEFFDYNCGFCRRATDFVFDLKAKDDDLELVFQELPVTNQASRGPALAALAIADTEHYAPFHREIMQAAGLVDADRALVIAEELGVPVGPIEAALAEGAAQEALHARLDESIDLADALGIDGTPAFLIASPDASFVRIIPGYNEAAIREAVADARAATKG